MNGFLLRLGVLTLVLTVCGGAALLFRLTRAGRCGRVMSRVWAAVLLLAILPLRLPDAWLPVRETPTSPTADVAAPAPTDRPAAEVTFTVIEQPAEPAEPVQVIEQTARRALPSLTPLLFAVWLGGGLVMAGLALRRHRRLCATLRTCSSPCDDAGTSAVFADLARRASLRRLPELRVLDVGIPLPPCTAGILRPCIYLPAELPAAPDSRAAILAHELCHIRRRDIWRKLFALAVCSAHWFNPLAHAILPRVYDDLEPACDRDTLRLLGGEPARIGYMQTLLEVAANLSVRQKDTLVLGLGSQKQQIERRFTSMKKTRLHQLYTALALLLICAMALGSAVLFTACTPAQAAADPREALTPLTERIVRYQNNLAPEDEITLEMLEAVTSLKLSVSAVKIDAITDQTLIDFDVNYIDTAADSVDALLTGVEFHQIMPKRFFEETVLAAVADDAWTKDRIESYYVLKAVDEHTGERTKAELTKMYPGIETCPCYLFDPMASENELATTFACFYAAGILDAQLLDQPMVDTDAIYAAFPNLTTLSLVGLTEAPPATAAALSPLVDRIVRYTYDLAPSDIITDEMLAGITSLRLEVSSIDTNINALVTEASAMSPEMTLDMMNLPDNASEDLIASMKTFVDSCNSMNVKYAAQRLLLAEMLAQKTLVSFNVNCAGAAEDSYEALVGSKETFNYIPKRFFEKSMVAQVTDSWTQKKVCAFYVLKDASDPTLTDHQREEMLTIFPWADQHPTYIGDPTTTAVDTLVIYYHLYEYGLLDAQLLDSTAVDTAQFAVFPNLTTLELVGLTEAN